MCRKELEYPLGPPYFAPFSNNLFNATPIPEANEQARGMEKARHPAKMFGDPHNNKRSLLNQLPGMINKQEPLLIRFQLFPVLEKAAQEQLLTWLPLAEV